LGSKKISLETLAIYAPNYEFSKILPRNTFASYGTLGKELGTGAYGTVHMINNSSFAIKSFTTKYQIPSHDSISETATLVRLQHPNIVEIVDLVTIKNNIGIILPIAVSDLRKALESNKFTSSELDKITYQILCGISYMHSRHIIHRDIKPGNILFYGIDDVRITDFGIVKPFACEPSARWTMMVYTLPYRAPEVLLGGVGRYGMPADVWAIGCVIWEIYESKHDVLFKPTNWTEEEQAAYIFGILGTPTTKWKDLKYMIDYVAPTVPIVADRSRIDSAFGSNLLRDMVNSILVYNSDERPTIFDLMKNVYFDSVRVLANEPNTIDCRTSHSMRDMRVPSYFGGMTEIKAGNRVILLDWLTDIARILKLNLRTYLMTVSLIDRSTYILNPKIIQYQSLGLAALSISVMICEKNMIKDNEYVYLSANAYTEQDILDMRLGILNAINYDVLNTVSYDYYANTPLLTVKDDWPQVKVFLLLFTASTLVYTLFPKEQFTLACGLVIRLGAPAVKSSFADECVAMATLHLNTALKAFKLMKSQPKNYSGYIKYIRKMSPTFDLAKAIENLSQ
jgi:serine/threonine protein kinase